MQKRWLIRIKTLKTLVDQVKRRKKKKKKTFNCSGPSHEEDIWVVLLNTQFQAAELGGGGLGHKLIPWKNKECL
jgi:hypothetical protein